MLRVFGLLTLLLAFVLAGCGGSDGGDESASGQSTETQAAEPVDFPRGDDKTIRALRA